MKSVDIIMVKYLAPAFEKEAIKAILKNTDIPYHLTIHDNYPLNENIGVLWNRLISKSEAEYICLLNTDTSVSYGWLEHLLEVFDDHEDAGAVGPVTNNGGGNGQELVRTQEKAVFDYRERHALGTLCGFCLVFPKKVWEAVGGFPEDFGFYGQECAFLAKVSKKGYKQYVRTDVFVWHKGSASAKLAERRGEMRMQDELEAGRAKRDAFFEELRKND